MKIVYAKDEDFYYVVIYYATNSTFTIKRSYQGIYAGCGVPPLYKFVGMDITMIDKERAVRLMQKAVDECDNFATKNVIRDEIVSVNANDQEECPF